MLLSSIPAKFNIPFASSAGAGFIRPIPQTPTGTPGQASLQAGFPPENFNPVAAGGTPPFGQDFNGLFNQVTAWTQFQNAGVAFPPYDPTFQTAVGGYPNTALVSSLLVNGLIYMSIVDNNLTNPDAGGAGWITFFRAVVANTDVYVNTTTGNDSNTGLSPSTAKKTIGAAVTLAWSFPPSQFTITLHIADGTYAEAVTIPLQPGPPVIFMGNTGSPSNVFVTGANNSHTFLGQGPNSVSIVGVRASALNTGAGNCCYLSQNGCQMTVTNCIGSGANFSVAEAAGPASLKIGNFTFNGNATQALDAINGGLIILSASVLGNFTVSGTPAFSQAFAVASTGTIGMSGGDQPTFTGAATGSRYNATLNGVINTNGEPGTYFPGNSGGTTSTGGQYA
jgi:hypothetical protein